MRELCARAQFGGRLRLCIGAHQRRQNLLARRLRPLLRTHGQLTDLVGASLLTSLALALTWTPNLSQFFIRERTGTDAPQPRSLSPRVAPARKFDRGAIETKFSK